MLNDAGLVVSPGAERLTRNDILRMWGLEQYNQNFEDNGVDLENFVDLSQPGNSVFLTQLIPLFGDAMLFKRRTKELFESDDTDENANKKSPAEPKTTNSNCGTSSTSLTGTSILQSGTIVGSTMIISSNSTFPLSTGIPDSNANQQVIEAGSNSNAIQPALQENQKRPRTVSEDRDSEIRRILKRTGYGRGLLRLAVDSSSIRSDADQNRLAELVIDAVVVKEKSYKLSPEDFKSLAKQIIEIFPEEKVETYYIPYRREIKVKFLAKGKLVGKYYAIRKYLKATGEISSVELDDDGTEKEKEFGDSIAIEGLEEKLKFLRSNIDDFEQITSVWKETSQYRLRCVQTTPHLLTKDRKPKKGEEEAQNSVSAYLALFPVLKSGDGYKLLCSDFDALYPDYARAIYSGWEGFMQKAFTALKDQERPCCALKDNLLLIEDDNYDKDVTDLIILLSLGYLDSVVTVTRIKKDNKFIAWRPPHPEIQEGVISLVETDAKGETFILQRFEKFEKWKIPIQPFCLAVGVSIHEVDTFWVIVDRTTRYKFTSAQRALDVCFKILHACHAKYSPEAFRLWMLIQRNVYGLKTSFDDLRSDAQFPKLLNKFK